MSDEQPSSSAAALRTGAEEGAPRERVEFVTVQRCDSVIAAEVIKSKLEAEGLTVRLSDANVASVAPHLASSMGGVGVLVPDEDAERARAFIDDMAGNKQSNGSVFRVLAHQGALMAAAGLLVGGVFSFLALFFGLVPRAPATLLPFGLAVGGYLIGRKNRRDFCSQLGCAHLLPQGATSCPGCGGQIVGELTDASDRLAAEEALREKSRPAGKLNP